MTSGITRGGDGGGPPRAALLGEWRNRGYALKFGKGKNFSKGLKKVVKKILGYETKISRGGKFKVHPGRQTP